LLWLGRFDEHKEELFFEKKNQKTFVPCASSRRANEQKCFVSFFQKRNPSLRMTPPPPANMNLWSVTALGIGAMVGAGVFAVMGQAALVAGNLTSIAFLVGGLIAALSGYSYAILAVHFPESGGVSAYFDRAFGTGRLSGTLSLVYMFTIAITVALVAKAFGGYAAPLFFGVSNQLLMNVFASCIIILLTLLNVWGSGLVGRAEIVLVAIKLVILAGLMIAGSASLIGKAPVAEFHPGITGLAGCVGLTFLAYAGYDNTANAASSVKNPRRTIPLAMFLAISTVVVLYVGLAFVVLANVPAAQIAAHSETAVAEAARPILGQAGYVIVSIGALLATASGINAWIYNGMNISLALAKAGQLPRLFRQIVWRQATRGILASVAFILLIVNFMNLAMLANITSAAFLIIYLSVYVAHWHLIGETRANRWLVGAGFLTMFTVLAGFVWTMILTQPWSAALVAIFVIGSWLIESFLMRKTPGEAISA
jgi:amino acid transporter